MPIILPQCHNLTKQSAALKAIWAPVSCVIASCVRAACVLVLLLTPGKFWAPSPCLRPVPRNFCPLRAPPGAGAPSVGAGQHTEEVPPIECGNPAG
jgi:hypothetical protein